MRRLRRRGERAGGHGDRELVHDYKIGWDRAAKLAINSNCRHFTEPAGSLASRQGNRPPKFFVQALISLRSARPLPPLP